MVNYKKPLSSDWQFASSQVSNFCIITFDFIIDKNLLHKILFNFQSQNYYYVIEHILHIYYYFRYITNKFLSKILTRKIFTLIFYPRK